ncbi:hypothetical protein BKA80DRAFT_257571 [Phyllosticta citrichinensis]
MVSEWWEWSWPLMWQSKALDAVVEDLEILSVCIGNQFVKRGLQSSRDPSGTRRCDKAVTARLPRVVFFNSCRGPVVVAGIREPPLATPTSQTPYKGIQALQGPAPRWLENNPTVSGRQEGPDFMRQLPLQTDGEKDTVGNPARRPAKHPPRSRTDQTPTTNGCPASIFQHESP